MESQKPGKWLFPRHALACLLVWPCICGGCHYQKRILWSPDGNLAAVIGGRPYVDQSLFLCDTNGALSPSVARDVYNAAWVPDSTALVIAQGIEVESWAEICDVLPLEVRSRVTDAAEALVQESDSMNSLDRKIREVIVSENARSSPGEKSAIRYCIRDHCKEKLGPKLPQKLTNLRPTRLHCLFLCTITNQLLTIGPKIAASLDPIVDIRVSPRDPFVAYTSGASSAGSWTLYAASLNHRGEIERIGENTGFFPDWTQDGKHLIFAVADAPVPRDQHLQYRLGSISGARVINDDGQEFVRPMLRYRIADIYMNEMVKVRTLRDGRILFSSMAKELASKSHVRGRIPSLFLFDPRRKPAVFCIEPTRSADVYSECVGLFELSPDERRVAIPGRKGAVSYMDLSSGNVTKLAEGWRDYDNHPYPPGLFGFAPEEIRSVPAWRTSSELCYVRGFISGDGHLMEEVVLHEIGVDAEVKSISRTWPQEAASGLIFRTGTDD